MRSRKGLFAVDMLPCRDGLQHILLTYAGGAGIEIDGVFVVVEAARKVGAPAGKAVRGGDGSELCLHSGQPG